MKLIHLVIVTIAVLLFGCASTVGKQITAADVSTFKNGETTMDEVVAKLGPPRTTTINSDGGKTIIYVYVRTEQQPQNFIPFVGLVAGGVNQTSSSMYFVFGPNGKLVTSKATEYQPKSTQFMQ